jgi:hypothetical protein
MVGSFVWIHQRCQTNLRDRSCSQGCRTARIPPTTKRQILLDSPGRPAEHGLVGPCRRSTLEGLVLSLSLVTIALVLAGIPAVPAERPAPATMTEHDVIPILLRHCTVCHGARDREGGLDLRSTASMLRGGKSGPAIVPGKPDESLLLRRIRAGEMPPRERLVAASVKPVEPVAADTIARWIEQGAPRGSVVPDVATADGDPLVGDEDRRFWAFQAPRPAALPVVRSAHRVRNAIDAFVLARLEERGLQLAPEAEPLALLRRVTLDLTGLPPAPEEVAAFLDDVAAQGDEAYTRLVDRLLASPRHGERAGQAWLDAAGYADTDGKREQDLPRLFAWRYRDYVVRSLNADKPYDRFLLEQVAGDELVDYEGAPEITPEIEECLVATGFLRMAPDPTWASITNFVDDRLDIVADELDVFASTVLGLTLRCARCHDHKIDPIPQRDYYRLADVFKGALDEHDWLRSGWHPGISSGKRADRELPFVAAAEQRAWQAHEHEISRQVTTLQGSLASLGEKPGKEADELRARIGALESQRQPRPTIRALWDRGEPSPTYVLHRGDPRQPGLLVGPGVPSVLEDGKTPFQVEPPRPGARSTGRRLALGRWLAKPGNSLVARVIVNRLWQGALGRGVVRTPGDFGNAGARPTHPELLDWLALELVRRDWSLKAMHRLIVTSAVYRQTSIVSTEAAELDPENELFSRAPLRRLDAEQVFDSLLSVAGALDETRGGPAAALESRPDGRIVPAPSAGGRAWRRAIYTAHERKRAATLLESFDLPAMNPSCLERRPSTVATQALQLLNDAFVIELAAGLARRIVSEAAVSPEAQVERIPLVALGRPPSAQEKAALLEALEQLEAEWRQLPASSQGPDPRLAALAGLCHVVLNSAGFLHVD